MPSGAAVWMPGVAHHAQRIVLVLDETAHSLERRLVLQPPVEDRAPGLVPPVRTDVVHRVELPEHVPVRVAGETQPQRRRPAGRGEADGAYVDDRDTELLLDGLAQCLAAPPADVEVGGLATVVGDGHDVVGREVAEADQWDRHTEGDTDEHVERVVDAEVDAGADGGKDHERTDALADPAGAAWHHSHVQDADDGGRHDCGRRRRQ